MRVQRLVTPLVVDVPHANRLVVAGADHVLAARMEHDAAHPVVVAVERKQAHADADVPNLRAGASVGGRWFSFGSESNVIGMAVSAAVRTQIVLSRDPDARNGP